MRADFLVDAHLDLALNALEWGRDLTHPVAASRAAERGMTDKPGRARGTVSFPELRAGGAGLVVATQIAGLKRGRGAAPVAAWETPEEAWAMTRKQLQWYRSMEQAGELKPITSAAELRQHLIDSQAGGEGKRPIGYVLSLEGADSLVTLEHLEKSYAEGLRAVGPAHYGEGVYACGTGTRGRLPAAGRQLLAEMQRLGLILDLTHLNDDCFWEALDLYGGPMWASHTNCRALVPGDRQFSDQQIKAVAGRGGVIGVALDAWMLAKDWQRGRSTAAGEGVRLDTVVNHIDHICQVTGSAAHVGIGSDLDGGFGAEQTPADVDTIADLRHLPERLRDRGWSAADIEGVVNVNFLSFLSAALPMC